MCGIAGFIQSRSNGAIQDDSLNWMTVALSHRGPDDCGQWFDREMGVALGHRRLSIVDLSPEGHQPMASESRRYHLSFNGEIYNFRELREELESFGHIFRGHSDTEVMLAAIEAWGVQKAVKRFVGMFAFALVDRGNKTLHLVRDRLGEKPLYYGWVGDVFLFGSELKALRAHPSWRGEIDRNALALFLRHNYVPAPYTIYNDIHKLLPGTIFSLSIADATNRRVVEPVPYWSAKSVAEAGAACPFAGNHEDAIERLDQLLRHSIRQQMIADVPLGAFLSGGIDSSTVVALMQAQSSRPVKTFTIGFTEHSHNEAQHAKAVARHLGTEHTEFYVKPEDALAVIPKLATMYDEPFSDSSQIPTFLVSQMARRYVTVSLSGDGGDELFCGYTRYLEGRNLWNKINLLPRSSRRIVALFLKGVPVSAWDTLLGWASPMLKRYGPSTSVGDKLHRAADVLNVNTPEMMYRRLASHWKEPYSIVINARELPTALTDPRRRGELHDLVQWMMFADTVSYLPDDILVKVDRAAMAVSLETRLPFLDHRIVEFAWHVPMNMKYRKDQGKWLLRQVLYRYVPKSLIERPKMGFAIPLGNWLRGSLRDWAESLLDCRRLHEEGFFNPKPIREKWEEHLSGARNWHYYLWDVLMFQAWLGRQNGS